MVILSLKVAWERRCLNISYARTSCPPCSTTSHQAPDYLFNLHSNLAAPCLPPDLSTTFSDPERAATNTSWASTAPTTSTAGCRHGQ